MILKGINKKAMYDDEEGKSFIIIDNVRRIDVFDGETKNLEYLKNNSDETKYISLEEYDEFYAMDDKGQTIEKIR